MTGTTTMTDMIAVGGGHARVRTTAVTAAGVGTGTAGGVAAVTGIGTETTHPTHFHRVKCTAFAASAMCNKAQHSLFAFCTVAAAGSPPHEKWDPG